MQVHEKEVQFKMRVKSVERVVVNINELVGLVQLRVVNPDGSDVQCLQGNSNRQSCEFKPSSNDLTFTAIVTGTTTKEQHFTVGFVYSNVCKKGILNSPTFVTLNGYVMDCYSFDINRPASLQYMSSLSDIEAVKKEILVQVLINEKESAEVRGNHHSIGVRDIITTCRLGIKTNQKDLVETCRITFNFVSYTKSAKSFQFVL